MNNDDAGGTRTIPIYLLIFALLGSVTATQLSRAEGQADASPAAAAPRNRTPPAQQGPRRGMSAVIADLLGAPCGSAPDIPCARSSLERRGITLNTFVIATMPDYVDSNSAWSFDPALDALQRAAAAAGYVLHRFYLPDWHADDQADPASGSAHESEPGVVLFQRAGSAEGRTDLLVVFIVTETPTLGLHEAPFVAAAGFIEEWSGAPYDLHVLGPTFSGSSPSLRRAITTFLGNIPGPPAASSGRQEDRRPPRKVRRVEVLSGSATSPRNKALLTFDWAAGTPAVPVTFSATVRSDRVMLRALHEHLVRINAKWNRGEGVALLVESNTAYGHAAGALSATPETHTADADDPFPLALRLPFPMHISRLRAQAESTRASPPTLRGPARVALGLGNSGPTTDVLPSMSPEPTAASVDTMLSQILATIRREEYGAIGILSTDKRDHLFLAERIVRESPNALLFTTEADLIYTHPDYKAFVRGAIVASTYPMFNGTQPLTAPHLGAAGRQQFPTMAAQGTYNALLKLLERDDLLLDYLPPRCVPGDARRRTETECSGPPVWIEVVGQNGIWPIGVHAVSEKEYTAPLNWKKQVASVSERTLGSSRLVHGSEDLTRHALLHVSPWLRLAFVVIMLGLLVHGIAYLAELGLWRTLTQRWIPALERGARRVRLREFGQAMRYVACLRLLQIDVADRSGAEGARGLRQEHRLFLLIGFTIVWFVALWSMRLFRIWGGEEVVTFAPSGITGINAGGSWGIPMVWLFVYLGLFAVLVGECVNAMGVRRAAAPDGWLPGALVTAAALVITFFAVSNVAGFIGSESWLDPDAAGLLFARTVNPSNWVSPAVPMIVLSGIIYWWSVWNIRHLLRGGWIYRAESAILDLLSGRERQLATQIVDTLTSPWRCQAWWTLGIPFGLLLSFWIYVPNWYTPDGHFFDGFLWWGSLLALFLVAHSLSQTVHLWLLVRRVLRHLFTLSMRDAFPVVAKQPLNWRLSLAPPLLTELTPMARKVRDLRLELRRLIGASTDPEHPTGQPFDERRRTTLPPAVGQVAGDPATAHTLRVRHQETDPMARELAVELPDVLVEEASGNASLPYFESRTWERLVRVSDTLLPVLIHGFWRRASHTGHTKLDDWYHNAEVLVGMQVAFILRDLVSRLVSGMTVSIGGAVLALAAHLFYSFPGRSAMLAFDWIVLALAVGGAVGMLVTLERDTVLSQLWSTTPGRVNWTGGFVYRLGLYGMVPVVTLFVWQFPEVGGTLFSWMEPLQKAIP